MKKILASKESNSIQLPIKAKEGYWCIYYLANEPWPIDWGESLSGKDLLNKDNLHYIGTSCIRNIENLITLKLVQLAQRILRLDSSWKKTYVALKFDTKTNISKSTESIHKKLFELTKLSLYEISKEGFSELLDSLNSLEKENGLTVPPLHINIVDINPDVTMFWKILQQTNFLDYKDSRTTGKLRYDFEICTQKLIRESLPLFYTVDDYITANIDRADWLNFSDQKKQELNHNEWGVMREREWLSLSEMSEYSYNVKNEAPLFTNHPFLYYLASNTVQEVNPVTQDITSFMNKHKANVSRNDGLHIYLSNISDHLLTQKELDSYFLSIHKLSKHIETTILASHRKLLDHAAPDLNSRKSQTCLDLYKFRKFALENRPDIRYPDHPKSSFTWF